MISEIEQDQFMKRQAEANGRTGSEPRERFLVFGGDPEAGSDPGVSQPGWYSGWMGENASETTHG